MVVLVAFSGGGESARIRELDREFNFKGQCLRDGDGGIEDQSLSFGNRLIILLFLVVVGCGKTMIAKPGKTS